MKTILLSYSFTGNNTALAKSISATLNIDHMIIRELRKRSMWTIFMDLILNRTPYVQPDAGIINAYDVVILAGPVWMGQPATPLRHYMREIEESQVGYAYLSISGGSEGGNPKLSEELKKWTGKKPLDVIDLHIADLLQKEPTPDKKTTMAYQITPADIAILTGKAIPALKLVLGLTSAA